MIFRTPLIMFILVFITGLFAQTIEVAPDSIFVTLASGDSTDVALTVSNTGAADLEYALAGDNITVEFTNCGAEGRFGPTQAQCNEVYLGTDLEGQVSVPADVGIQEWTVPYAGIYTIEAYGAQGGGDEAGQLGGYGAKIQADIFLQAGAELNILVGQRGLFPNANQGKGGGGGSGIYSAETVIIAAGGGGGGAYTNSSGDKFGRPGQVTTYGQSSPNGAQGGSNGSGGWGGFSQGDCGFGGGGGGFSGDGLGGGTSYAGQDSNNMGGESVLNGGNGAIGTGCSGAQNYGGFGFGGGGTGNYGGGGGGGYSGEAGSQYTGAGSNPSSGGGGGGSYYAGENQDNESGVNEGHGRVIITLAGLPGWISASTDTSTVSPGYSEDLPLNINAIGVAAGEHLSNVIIHSNDTLNTPLEIPVLLTVTGTPEMALPVSDVVFDPRMIGLSDTVNFVVQNTGSDSLIVDLSSDNTDFVLLDTALTIPAFSENSISVVFSPFSSGEITGTLTLASNADTQTASLTGTGMNPPVIQITPIDSLSLELSSNNIYDTTIVVSNIGIEANLSYQLIMPYSANTDFSDDFELGLTNWTANGFEINSDTTGSFVFASGSDPPLLELTNSISVFSNDLIFSYNFIENSPWGFDVYIKLQVNDGDWEFVGQNGNSGAWTETSLDLSNYVNIGDIIKVQFSLFQGGYFSLDDVSFSGAGTTQLSASSSDILAPGEPKDIPVHIDLTNFAGGDYTYTLLFESNDPITPSISYPVILHITGEPLLSVASDSLNFAAAYTNATSSNACFDLKNYGSDILNVELSSSNSDFMVDSDVLNISAYTGISSCITFTPTSVGAISGDITITSNGGSHTIFVSGIGVDPSVLNLSTDYLFFSMDSGSVAVDSLIITNTGASEMIYSIIDNDFSDNLIFSPSLSDTLQPTESNTVLLTFSADSLASGDYFGNIYIESSDPNGPDTLAIQVHINGTPDISVVDGIHMEDFDDDSWTEFWSTAGSQYNPNISSSYYNSAPYSLRIETYNYDSYIISDTLTSNSNLSLSFWYYLYKVDTDCNFQVQLKVNDGEFQTVWESVSGQYSNHYLYIEETISLALGWYLLDGDNYQIRFLSHPYSPSSSSDYVDVYIDDIIIMEGSEQINFGDVYTFDTSETSLLLSNPGTDTLRVTDISFDNAVFSTDISSINIPMGDMANLSVFATPTLVGLDSSIVTITSNAGTESIMAYVNGVSHPMLMFDPVAIFDTLLVGDSANYNITISNPGDDTLTFDAGDFYGDLAGSFADDFENGLGQWGYTGSYAMELSSLGEGYNSDYSMVAGDYANGYYYQEMIEYYEMRDIENATLELWGKCSSGWDWLYLYVDHGNGWEGNWNIFTINNSSWTHYSYDLTSFLNDRGVSEGDDVRFKLRIYSYSNTRYIDDISITGIGGANEGVLDSNYTHVLLPGESTDINISYVVPAVSGGELVGGLEFTSNDPANESAQYPISLFVNGPDLSTIFSLEFSDILLGTDEVQDFPIYNVGTLDLVIDSLTLSNTDYELQNLPAFPVTLPPGDSTLISVRYPAYDVYDHLTDLSIYSNDLGSPIYAIALNTNGTINNFKIDLSEGWNMIGPVQTTPVTTVIDSFSVVAPYTYYGWDGMYISIDTLYAGNGYWTLATSDGNIFVPNIYDVEADDLPRTSLDSHESLQSLSRISFNNDTYTRTMYFGNYDYLSLPYETFLMPPIMTNIVFDVRYSDESFLTTEEETEINIMAEDFPLTVNWQISNRKSPYERRYLLVGDKQVDMDEVTSYTIEEADIGRVSLINRIIPEEFGLYPNYPNPFNPVTSISYGLSQDAEVRLVIYDVMGRVVKELYSGYNASGMYTRKWHGDSQTGLKVATGMYIIHLDIRLDGGEHKSITSKCILLK